MKNKKGTIILSIILTVQFIIPLSIWGYESYKNKELEEKGQEVKVLINYADYCENRIEFQIIDLYKYMDIAYSENFIVFKNYGYDFWSCEEADAVPESDLYVSKNRLNSVYRQDWCFKYKSEITMAQDEYDYYQLYNKGNESDNITKGYCQGPETQAYAVLKVYKNRFKVVNIYIDGTPVDTLIDMYNNDEWDNSRYEYQYGKAPYEDYEIYDDEFDEYYGEATIDDEYITEPVVA